MPEAPSGLTLLAGDNRIRVSWDPVAGVQRYEYRYLPTAGGAFVVVPTTATMATITGLDNGQGYLVWVRSVAADRTVSDWADAQVATPRRIVVHALAEDHVSPRNSVPREGIERLAYAQAPDRLNEMLLFYTARGNDAVLEAEPLRYLSDTAEASLVSDLSEYEVPPVDFAGDFSNRPAAAFFEQRLVVGGGPRRRTDPELPGQWSSITGSKRPDETTGRSRYYNLGAPAMANTLQHSDAYNFTLDEPFTIRWLATYYNYLVLGTNLGIWLARGLDPTTAPDTRMLSRIGANHVRPLTILSGNSHTGAGSIASFVGIVWVGVDGRRIYMTPGDRDLTEYSSHLFTLGIKEIHWQKEPENRLWALMRDGTVAVMQMRGESGISGWSRVTIARRVVSMCVQQGYEGEDVVWALMEWDDIPRRHAICRLSGRYNLDMSWSVAVRPATVRVEPADELPGVIRVTGRASATTEPLGTSDGLPIDTRPAHVEVPSHIPDGTRMRAVDTTAPPYVWYDAPVRSDAAGSYLPLDAEVIVVQDDRGITTALPVVRGADISNLDDLVVANDPALSPSPLPTSLYPATGAIVVVGFPFSANLELPQIASLEGIAIGQPKRVSRITAGLIDSTGGQAGPAPGALGSLQRDAPGFEGSGEVAIEPPDGGLSDPRRSVRIRYDGPGRFQIAYLVAEIEGG